MFNVYAFDKKLARDEELKRLKEEFVQEEMRRRTRQAKLVTNYKKRIENFVLQVNDKPIAIRDSSPEILKIREEDSSKFLGPPNFVIRSFKHEKDRIQEAIEKNKEFRTDGVGIPFEFRKRDGSKDIQPQMRFATQSNLERLYEKIDHIMGSDVQSDHRISPGILREISKSPQTMNQFIAKHIRPDMNLKTHFKAAETLALQMDLKSPKIKPTSKEDPKSPQNGLNTLDVENRNKFPKSFQTSKIREFDLPEPTYKYMKSVSLSPAIRRQPTNMIEEEREQEQKLKEQQSPHEVVNPAEVSKKVLLKCKIIKQKDPNAHQLSKGEGHLMSMSELSVGDIYRNVYSKIIGQEEN